MKKSFIKHIVVMIVAVALGAYLANLLTVRQSEIAKTRDQLSRSPLGGFNKVTSDMQWMLFINYCGGLESVSPENVDEVYGRLKSILANDPDFEMAYNIGGMLLSVEAPVRAAEILMQGANNPKLKNNWQIPFMAGHVLEHYVTDKDDPKRLKKAEEMFRLAAAHQDAAPYVTSALLRTRAQRLTQKGTWSTDRIPIVNKEQAYLCALYDEWRNSDNSELSERNSLNIANIKTLLIQAAQDAKASDPGNKYITATIRKVLKNVLEDQHLCAKCLAPYAAGDRFCAQCGTSVTVYGVCPKCKGPVKGRYCSACGGDSASK